MEIQINKFTRGLIYAISLEAIRNRLTANEGKIEKNSLGERFRGRDKIKINNPCEVGSSFQWAF